MRKKLANKAISRLQDLIGIVDEESAHVQADLILCELLEDLGYKKVVEKYDEIDKYYA